ncbi:MAG: 50S ribosomal protein L10 [Chloroflexi bacterium]|nr:50S ribosomal protein L10 [Chloroflexota bacterium]
MALSKEKKNKVVQRYESWIKDSVALYLTEYTGLDMPAIDNLRAKVREAGGEYHVMKNRLGKLAFDAAGYDVPEEYLSGSTAIGVAFEDAPGVAKAIVDFAKDKEVVKIKGGFLRGVQMEANEIIRLATLPPLPVVRSQFLALLMTPATQLTRLLAEPGRQLAQVVKAFADQGAAPEPVEN